MDKPMNNKTIEEAMEKFWEKRFIEQVPFVYRTHHDVIMQDLCALCDKAVEGA